MFNFITFFVKVQVTEVCTEWYKRPLCFASFCMLLYMSSNYDFRIFHVIYTVKRHFVSYCWSLFCTLFLSLKKRLNLVMTDISQEHRMLKQSNDVLFNYTMAVKMRKTHVEHIFSLLVEN